MKSMIMTAFFAVATTFGFAAETITLTAPVSHIHGFDVKSDYNAWRGYVRLGLSNSRPNDDFSHMFPDVGVGIRYALPVGALDVSTSYTGDYPFSKKDGKTYFYTAPRASYLLYISPEKNNSLYGGVGIAFGGLKKAHQGTFHGFIPSVSAGYEMNRGQRVSNFVQLDVSQPALATSLTSASALPTAKAAVFKTVGWNLGPIVQFSAGCGF